MVAIRALMPFYVIPRLIFSGKSYRLAQVPSRVGLFTDREDRLSGILPVLRGIFFSLGYSLRPSPAGRRPSVTFIHPSFAEAGN